MRVQNALVQRGELIVKEGFLVRMFCGLNVRGRCPFLITGTDGQELLYAAFLRVFAPQFSTMAESI